MTIPNRTVTITGEFAGDAVTTIPADPVSGISYRNTAMTSTVVREGWAFKTIVDSANFNQALFEYSSVTKQMETYGFLPWSNLTNYVEGSLCLGSNGVIYQAKQNTGPSSTSKDPTTDTLNTYWEDFVGKTYATIEYVRSYMSTILGTIYPVGSIYIGTQNTCPMASLISGSTWSLVSSGKALWTGDGTNGNTTIAAGLPNIYGSFATGGTYGFDAFNTADGCFILGNSSNTYSADTSTHSTPTYKRLDIVMSASRVSTIYGNSSTVQPPAYRVNVWRRTA